MAIEWIKKQNDKPLSGSALKILEILDKTQEVSASDLKDQLNFSTRTIHYALKTLQDRSLIEKKPYLLDMRQTRYVIAQQILKKAKSEASFMIKEQSMFFTNR
ncbi:MAG: hypothetical protein HeimC3_00490 [Candidatus Heimdallarchaeota archaeon LC_3]|nr:MAG: hypothetical protein HeimC3_00490 [Candidatus Heimdallarchaeota archaeon LC_3]